MTQLRFYIALHSRFRVGAAYPRDGIDQAADLGNPIPADHLKGLMRASASELVTWGAVSEKLVDEVFGTAAHHSPWAWSGAVIEYTQWIPGLRHRVKIDSGSGTAQPDNLAVAEEVGYAPLGVHPPITFTVSTLGRDPDGLAAHTTLLRTAARNIKHLGAWRRRGLGWVGIDVLNDVTGVNDDLRLLRSGEEVS